MQLKLDSISEEEKHVLQNKISELQNKMNFIIKELKLKRIVNIDDK
jgi:hypothetical protein